MRPGKIEREMHFWFHVNRPELCRSIRSVEAALLKLKRHEVVRQVGRAKHLRAGEGEICVEHFPDSRLSIRLKLQPDIRPGLLAKHRTRSVRKLKLAAALQPHVVVRAQDLHSVLIRRNESFY